MGQVVKNNGKILMKTVPIIMSLIVLAFITNILASTSFGADEKTIMLETQLEKYINYSLLNNQKGSLVQYHVKMGMEYGENKENTPIKNSELELKLNQIDGKYPSSVKAIAKSTKATNGKTENLEEKFNYNYDSSKGTLYINASNQDEKGNAIRNNVGDKERDEYIIIANYDTYTEAKTERTVSLSANAKVTLFSDGKNTVNKEEYIENKVTEEIGEITSVAHNTESIYNGYIKSNLKNGTNYETKYKEISEIMVSKKEALEKIEMAQNNTFVKIENENINDLGNNKNLIYKSTKITKNDVVNLLGEEGTIEIIDASKSNNEEQKVIAKIDKETEYDNDGTITINYEEDVENIIVKTSKVQNEGSIKLESEKQIKSTMLSEDAKILTSSQINGNKNENLIEIKDATTNMKMDVNPTTWTNEQQNNVTFTINLNNNDFKSNMLKNPKIQIDLPEQVEKVILGNYALVYGNGLELQEPYLENNGRTIIANLTGEQTKYYNNNLGLIANVKISATIILKKDIQKAQEKVILNYENGEDKGSHEVEVQIESYQKEEQEMVKAVAVYEEARATNSNNQNIKLEVAPVKGNANISNGDTIYEGEFIKYNVKITNTSESKIDNVKIVGDIAKGTKYGELEADYNNPHGVYKYNFDESMENKEINIGTLEAGETVSNFYEVQVNDLKDEEEIISKVRAYTNNEEVANYEIKNTVKPAEAKVFLGSELDNERDRWNYLVEVTGEENKEYTLKVILPKEFAVNYWTGRDNFEFTAEELSQDNVVTTKVKPGSYIIGGTINSSKLIEETEEAKTEIKAVANLVVNDNTVYQSNENRILYTYENVSIEMMSSNEGEKVAYGEEIDYKIKITNRGKTNYNDPAFTSINVNVTDLIPADVEPISVTYQDYIQEYLDENGQVVTDIENAVMATAKYRKSEPITEEIETAVQEENGEAMPNINLFLTVPYQESVTLDVKATAGWVGQETKVDNSATVKGDEIKTKTSNTVSHIIVPKEEEPIEEDPNISDGEEIPVTPVGPNTSNSEQTKTQDGKHSISGIVWQDQSEDGQRQEGENRLSDIKVTLVNPESGEVAKDVTGQEAMIRTNERGEYTFKDLNNGSYIVVFEYNTKDYYVTDYRKAGVSEANNCDATVQNINLQGSNKTVAMTDVIDLSSSISNIDLGLIETKTCDMKIDKTVSKVTVKTTAGTKQLAYNNDKLAKVEIKAKEIEGATVVIEYKLAITNVGESPATVGKIVDYLPEGLRFSSDLNNSWTTAGNGEIVNTSLSSQKIEPGKSVEVPLVAIKAMTQDSTGTFTNKAAITNITNVAGATDEGKQNNESQADVIISVGTGAVIFYVSIVIIGLGAIATIVYLKRNKKLAKVSKISLLFLLGMMMVLAPNMESIAKTSVKYPSTTFYYIYGTPPNDKYTHKFSGGPGNLGGLCIQNGIPEWNGSYDYLSTDGRKAYKEDKSEIKIDLNYQEGHGKNDPIEITKIDKGYVLRTILCKMFL